jgi:diguanylate cyclase (GGDEF)-like protein/PAS domain S-box-containing protein
MDTPPIPSAQGDESDPARERGDGGMPSRRAARQLEFWESLYELSADVSLVIDSETHIIFVAPGFADMLGFAPHELLARVGLDFIHPDDAHILRTAIEEVSAAPARVVTVRFRGLDADGGWHWLENTITNRLHDAVIGGFVVTIRDVTAEVAAQQAASEYEFRLRAIVEGAQEGIAAIGFDGKPLFINSRAAELLGRPMEELQDADILEVFGFDDAEAMRQLIQLRLERGPERYDLHYSHPDGDERVLSLSASPYVTADGRFLGTLAMVSDVTVERRAEAVLRRQALEDPLTGLGNRRVLTERLAEVADGHADAEVAVVMLDIDDLRGVNEVHGHEAGDRFLVELAGRLREVAGDTHAAVRLGGDEFALVLEGLSSDEVDQVVNRVRASLRALPVAVEGHPLSATVGIAMAPPHPPDKLLRYAGIALDEAKRTGSGGVVVFDDDLERRHRRRRAIASLARREVVADEVRLHYQPLVDMVSGEIKGFEALLRWNHPTLGPIRPDEIVEAFEALGTSSRLDELVLSRACHDLRDLRDAGVISGDAYLSVNVSAATLDKPGGFQATLESLLGETCVPPDRLVLEVTEGAVMRDPERVSRVLHRLTDEGLRLAVDDFGTGYSSLRYLQTLPLSILKVDRSFVAPLNTDPRARTLADSIVTLARMVGLDTVAEGVETPDQLDILLELGCTTGQGFLWSPAVPPEGLGELTRRLNGGAVAG